MKLLERTEGEWPAAGEWRPLGDKALVACPGCGESATLTDHTIKSDGAVHPSLVCPFDGCDFHDWVKLSDWSNQMGGKE